MYGITNAGGGGGSSSVAWNDITGKPTFATVATSGSYNDLSNKPTIPSIPVEITRYSPDAGSFFYFLKSDIDKLKEYPLIVSFIDYNNMKYCLFFYKGYQSGSSFSYFLSTGLSAGASSQRLDYTLSSDSFTFQGGTYTYDSTNDYYYTESDN